MLLLTLIAPVATAAGADQGSLDLLGASPAYVTSADLANATVTSENFPILPVFNSRPTQASLSQDGLAGWHNADNTDFLMVGTSASDVYLCAISNSQGTRAVLNSISASPHYLYQYWYGDSNTNSTQISASVNNDAGYYMAASSTGLTDFSGINAPVFYSVADAIASFDAFVSAAGNAVLITAGTSYEWCTGYQLTNSGTSDIAGGWYNHKFYVATYTPNYRITNSTVSVNFSLYDNATGLYYSMVQLIGDSSDEIGPQFDSSEAFFASAVEVLDDSSGGGGFGSEVEGVPGTFDLPAGYVGYLHLYDPTVEITLSTTMNRYSAIGGGWNANQTYKSGTTLPYGSRQFPSSGSSVIQWNKDASGQTNLLGQTKAARRTFTASANLIEIYNPYYQDAGGNSEDGNTAQATINNTIHGSTVGIMSWVIYPVEDNMSASNFSGIDSTLPEGSTGNPAINDGNNNWTSFEDSDGNQYIPPEGGLNAPVGGSSITDILNNFFTRFFGLFTEGHDAIRNLTQQASEFVSHLSELYSWLPPQVLSVLTSAIILAIIIGVLKVFL